MDDVCHLAFLDMGLLIPKTVPHEHETRFVCSGMVIGPIVHPRQTVIGSWFGSKTMERQYVWAKRLRRAKSITRSPNQVTADVSTQSYSDRGYSSSMYFLKWRLPSSTSLSIVSSVAALALPFASSMASHPKERPVM